MDTSSDESDSDHNRKIMMKTEATAGVAFRSPLPIPIYFLSAAMFLILSGAPAIAQTPVGGNAHISGGISELIFILILIFINSLFVLAETAMLTVRRTRIEQLAEEGNRSAKVALKLLSEPTRMLATIQVGLTLVELLAAGSAAEKEVEPFAAFLRHTIGAVVPILGYYSHLISFLLIIFIVSLLTLVIGEITPKSLAIKNAEPIALISAIPIQYLQVIFSPLVSIVTVFSKFLTKPFGGTVSFSTSVMSEEELKIMVEQSEEHGVIESEEKEMIHSIFDFADTAVRKVMTNRLDITAVSVDIPSDEFVRVVTETGHSRIPVYEGELDNIIGVVHVKDVLRRSFTEQEHVRLREVMRSPYFIPENKRVDDLLAEMKRGKMQIALVRDEYGALAGVVTIEDLLEEIVGDIQDEYDKEEEPTLRRTDDNSWVADGMISLNDFNERMGTDIPLEETNTLGGFVFGLMGHQPIEGEQAVWENLVFRVNATDGRRIQKVSIMLTPNLEEQSTPQDHSVHEQNNKETTDNDSQ